VCGAGARGLDRPGTPAGTAPHMQPEEFRRWGHAAIDWIADYWQRVDSLPVGSTVRPGDVRRQLPAAATECGEPFDQIMADVDRVVLPGVTHWQSPSFFGYFPANVSGPAVLGDLISSGLGVQGMLWSTSPACTEIEAHVLDWLVDLLGLPAGFRSDTSGGGVIQDSASSAAVCALLAARERLTQGQSNRSGCSGGLTVYASSQVHSSVEKAVGIVGLGRENLRLIEVDAQFAMRPDRLAEVVAQDRQAGMRPCLVCATIGTTSSTAVDPVPVIGEFCRREGIWLHIDAAMAGTAALCPEFRWLHQGVEFADSYCFNPHKWMLTNFDCDCFYVADRRALIEALTILPEYLRNPASQSGAVIDYRDWQVPLGRRFRSLKLWFVLRYYGAQGLRTHLRQHVQLARSLADWIAAEEGFEVVVPPILNLVCFCHRAGDEFNERLLARLNASGALYLTHTRLNSRFVLRLCIGQSQTQEQHVRAAWDRIRQTARELIEAADHPAATR